MFFGVALIHVSVNRQALAVHSEGVPDLDCDVDAVVAVGVVLLALEEVVAASVAGLVQARALDVQEVLGDLLCEPRALKLLPQREVRIAWCGVWREG